MINILLLFKNELKPHKKCLIIAILALCIMNFATYSMPIGIGYLFGHVFGSFNENYYFNLYMVCGLLLLANILRSLFFAVMTYSYNYLSNEIIFKLRNKYYLKLNTLSLDKLDKIPSGDLISRASNDMQLLSDFFCSTLNLRLKGGLYIVSVFILLIIINIKLTLCIFFFTPVCFFLIKYFGGKLSIAVLIKQKQTAQLSEFMEEFIRGIRSIKANAINESLEYRFNHINNKKLKSNLKVLNLQGILSPYLFLFAQMGSLIIILYGGYMVIVDEIHIGEFMAYFSYLAILNWPIMMLAPTEKQIKLAKIAARRIINIYDKKNDPTQGTNTDKVKGKIHFENVCFNYGTNKLFNKLNFHINHGESIAIFGPTGVGKTTLLYLLLRLYHICEGKIMIDNTNINDFNLAALRSQIGCYFQSPFIFSASIKENITLGADISNEKIVKACTIAQIHDYIISLPKKYDTILSENGSNLSGGQKQRITLARTLSHSSNLLLLDGCTSSVDAKTEKKILDVIFKNKKERTIVFVAQNIKTLNYADRILFINNNKEIQIGTHNDLINSNKSYKGLYDFQINFLK